MLCTRFFPFLNELLLFMVSTSILLIETSRFLRLFSFMALLRRSGKSRGVVERWLRPSWNLFIFISECRALAVVISACSHFEVSAIISIIATLLRSPGSCLDWVGLSHLVSWLRQILRRGLSSRNEIISWHLERFCRLSLPILCELGSSLKFSLSNVVNWLARFVVRGFLLTRFCYLWVLWDVVVRTKSTLQHNTFFRRILTCSFHPKIYALWF